MIGERIGSNGENGVYRPRTSSHIIYDGGFCCLLSSSYWSASFLQSVKREESVPLSRTLSIVELTTKREKCREWN